LGFGGLVGVGWGRLGGVLGVGLDGCGVGWEKGWGLIGLLEGLSGGLVGGMGEAGL
jgi:hypothetical protein